MAETQTQFGEVEGDYGTVKVQLCGGSADATPKRPTKGSQMVWGGTGPSSPWGHLIALIEKAGGTVAYTYANASDLVIEPVQVEVTSSDQAPFEDHPHMPEKAPDGTPNKLEAAKQGKKDGQEAKDESPKEDGKPPGDEPGAQGEPPPPAAGAGADAHGVGPLFEKGIDFKFGGNEARVWAHAYACASGPRPLVVFLHGINHVERKKHPALSDRGLHVGKMAGALIDAGKVTPLVIAAPTSFSNGPWEGFNLGAFVEEVVKEAEAHNVHIDLDQVSVVGHSGAGGYGGRGLNRIADEHGMFDGHKLHIFGIADTCITEDNARKYAAGLHENDHTAIYSVHRYTGGWPQYSGSAKWASALGATEKTDNLTGNEDKADLEDAYDNAGSGPLRMSLKFNRGHLAKLHGPWRETGGYPETLGDHSDMVPLWAWYALPRFYPATDHDKHALQEPPHDHPPAPPPPPGPTITGGEWSDVPPAPDFWMAGEGIEPKDTGPAVFAETGSGIFWPVRNPKSHYGRAVCFIDANGKGRGPGKSGSCGRNFLADRPAGSSSPDRYHVGIDVFGDYGNVLVACESGEIIQWQPFYFGVYKLLVKCDSGLVINYGEVDPSSLKKFGLKKGDRVLAGQPIAVVGKMKVDSMLHFEMYPSGTGNTSPYYRKEGKEAARRYLNPTRYLLNLAARGR